MSKKKRTAMTDPFKGFDPNKADQLLRLAEEICDNEQEAALHLAACLMGLVPDLQYAHLLCECVDIQAKKVEN
jgi:hypothetical protein